MMDPLASEEILYTVRGPKTLPEMTWEEVAEALQRTNLVVIPCGAIEQHGPHLPLGTDALNGTYLSRLVVQRLTGQGSPAVAGPTISLGVSQHHIDFPGTCSLRASTFIAVVKDVCESLAHNGFRKFALIMTHGGNWPAMQVAAQELKDAHPELKILALNTLPAQGKVAAKILKATRRQGHAGEAETARGMAAYPGLVQMARARVYYSQSSEEFETSEHPLLGGGVYEGTASFRTMTPWGSMGEPALATAETGHRLFEARVEFVCDVIKRKLVREPAPVGA